jgi:hypothetical protein
MLGIEKSIGGCAELCRDRLWWFVSDGGASGVTRMGYRARREWFGEMETIIGGSLIDG